MIQKPPMILPEGMQPPQPQDPWQPLGTPQEMVQELSDVMAEGFYENRPCPFKPGQLVTPKQVEGVRGHGRPHMVLEVWDEVRMSDYVPGGLIRPYNMIIAVSLYGREHRFPEISDSYELFGVEAGSDETEG